MSTNAHVSARTLTRTHARTHVHTARHAMDRFCVRMDTNMHPLDTNTSSRRLIRTPRTQIWTSRTPIRHPRCEYALPATNTQPPDVNMTPRTLIRTLRIQMRISGHSYRPPGHEYASIRLQTMSCSPARTLRNIILQEFDQVAGQLN